MQEALERAASGSENKPKTNKLQCEASYVEEQVEITCSIMHLPIELLVHILCHLPLPSLLSASAVCRYFNTASRHNAIWRLLFTETFGAFPMGDLPLRPPTPSAGSTSLDGLCRLLETRGDEQCKVLEDALARCLHEPLGGLACSPSDWIRIFSGDRPGEYSWRTEFYRTISLRKWRVLSLKTNTRDLKKCAAVVDEFASDGHSDEAWNCSWSPNGRYLASSSKDGEVILWRLSWSATEPQITGESPRLQFRLTKHRQLSHPEDLHSSVVSHDWHPSSRLLITTTVQCVVAIWEVETGALLHLDRTVSFDSFATWHPSGRAFVVGHRRCQYETLPPTEFLFRHALALRLLGGRFKHCFEAEVVHHSGASPSPPNDQWQVVTPRANVCIFEIPHNCIHMPVLTPNGEYLLFLTGNSPHHTNKAILTRAFARQQTPPHSPKESSPAMPSFNHSALMAPHTRDASFLRFGGGLFSIVGEVEGREWHDDFYKTSPATAETSTTDQQDEELDVHRTGEDAYILFSGHCLGFSISHDSNWLAANVRRFTNVEEIADNPMQPATLQKCFVLEIYRLPSLEKVAALEGHVDDSPEDAEPYLVWPEFSPDGRYILSGCGLGRVLIFDLHYQVQVASVGHHLDLVNSCSWHPHFTLLATASDDTGVRLLAPCTFM
eukprot:CAMPEP_0177634202 /NCGR_PEP_ID=MMETSP0447-20121125/3243_1 /TAXON_ID=0 /ORGANISM="Stygamoeba regulata, Strain BSH-02190019" /LENGTH=664 /DNA_ID=CAMNT_0019135909 /DNA_START=52 /DNA_END=2046 /DNA_ORIENTATION=+